MNHARTRNRGKPSKFRRFWDLAPGTVFLNHGSFGACPSRVLAHQAELRRQMEAEPVQFLWRWYEKLLDPSRRILASFIGANPRDVVFVTNATTGVNAVLRSVRLRPGDEILTTDHDYNACRNVLLEGAAQHRAKVTVAPVPFPLKSSDDIVEAIVRCASKRTRLALIDHVTSSSAMIFPVSRIVKELEARGIDTLVDGAHAPGMVRLNLAKLNPAYYTANLHKWVCAPKGAGLLWAREDKQEQLQPAVISHGNNTPRSGYSAFQDRFDWAGTFDPTAWFCVGPAIEWMGKRLPGGWRAVRERNHHLAVHARRILCGQLDVQPPCPESMLGAMATLRLPKRFQGLPRAGKIDVEQSRLHDEFGIEVPFFRIGRPEQRYIRISAQLYNTIRDYRDLAAALLALP